MVDALMKNVSMYNSIVLAMLCMSLVCVCTMQAKKFHFIGCQGNGFFSSFMGVLNNLRWAEIHHVTPVVYWDSKNPYWQQDGFHESYNAWEYYFKRVSNLHYEALCNRQPLHRSYKAPDGSTIIASHTCPLSEYARLELHRLIRKYVRVHDFIQETVDRFYVNHMQNKYVIGIHVRGTDKYTEVPRVSCDTLFDAAKKMAEQAPSGVIVNYFVASDESAMIDEANKAFGSQLIVYDAIRSSDKKAIHRSKTRVDAARKGLDVLIEALLLSRCNGFVHTISNVAFAALAFNVDLHEVTVQ